jgi:hypothetical protein
MARGEVERVADAGQMIGGVGLEVRIPLHFLGEDDLAVDERGALAVGAAQIEADAASGEMASERQVGGRGDGQGGRLDRAEGQRPFEDLAEEVGVERAGAGGGVIGLQAFGERPGLGTTEQDLLGAARPEQELHRSLDVQIRRCIVDAAGQHVGAKQRGRPVGATERDREPG